MYGSVFQSVLFINVVVLNLMGQKTLLIVISGFAFLYKYIDFSYRFQFSFLVVLFLFFLFMKSGEKYVQHCFPQRKK